MSQVSKRYLPEEKFDKIFSIFFEIISSIFDKKEAEAILSELLTPTEKIMLAKRITCFYLLRKEVSIYQIAETIKLSTSTVSYLKHILSESPQIQDYLANKINHEKIKNFMEDLLVEFLYGGLRKGSNWKTDKKMYYQHKQKRQQPL